MRTMKLQDKYPFDSAVFGLNQLYIARADNSFLINYAAIISPNHIVHTGQTFMLIRHQDDVTIDSQMVRLIDCYNDNVNINLALFDILKRKNFALQLDAHEPKRNYQWILLDVSFVKDEIEKFIVMRYCDCKY